MSAGAVADQSCLRCGSELGEIVVIGTDRLYETTDEIFGVWRCRQCGMLRLSPRPEADELEQYYPRKYWFDPQQDDVSRLAERYRRLVLLDHVGFVSEAYRAAGGQGCALDIGCGGGLLPGMLRERGLPVIGFDFSVEACAIAWNRHGVPCASGEFAASPFAARSFALVSLFHVVEHLPDPAAYFAEARRILTANGRLIVQVPNADSWQFRLLGGRWNGLDIPRHLNDFRAEDVLFLLEKAGFEVTRTKHFSWRDNPAGLATSIAPWLDPMSRRIRGRASGLAHHAAYLALVLACIPFTALEAAFGHGSTIMVEAKLR